MGGSAIGLRKIPAERPASRSNSGAGTEKRPNRWIRYYRRNGLGQVEKIERKKNAPVSPPARRPQFPVNGNRDPARGAKLRSTAGAGLRRPDSGDVRAIDPVADDGRSHADDDRGGSRAVFAPCVHGRRGVPHLAQAEGAGHSIRRTDPADADSATRNRGTLQRTPLDRAKNRWRNTRIHNTTPPTAPTR